jgi:prevent-host-death family protein
MTSHRTELEVMGITGSLSTRWAALPTVTATAKPAITPLIGKIQGQACRKTSSQRSAPARPPLPAISARPSQPLATPSAAPWLEERREPRSRPIVVASLGSSMSEVVAIQVSVRELKTHLSEWLSRVQAGEVVEVTSHRKPIARITAVKSAEPTATNPLQKAIDAGLISWNGRNPEIPPPVKLNDGGPLMSDIVIEDRG